MNGKSPHRLDAPCAADRPHLGRRLLLLATSFACLGCLDLTVPPNVGEDSGANTGGADMGDDASPPSGGAAGGGAGGSGGQAGSGGQSGSGGSSGSDASSGDARRDGWDGGKGTGGRVSGTGGNAGPFDGALGGTGGGTANPDSPADEHGDTDAGAKEGPDASPETTVDTPISDDAADGPSSPLQAGLIAYYPCEQADGTMLRDRSGHENHGTLQGANGSSYRIESGKFGNGLTLIQSGAGHVTMPPTIFTGSTELTVAVWVKVNSLTSWQRLLDIGINANLSQNTANGTVYMALYLKSLGNKLGATSTKDGFSTAQQVTADTLPTGTWKHVAVVLGSGAATLYVDGTAMNMINPFLPPQALGTLDYAYLGKSQFTSDPYADAQIDEFRVYSRALSASEVQALVQYAVPAALVPASH